MCWINIKSEFTTYPNREILQNHSEFDFTPIYSIKHLIKIFAVRSLELNLGALHDPIG